MKKRTIVREVIPLNRAAFRAGRRALHDGDLLERLLDQALGGTSSDLIIGRCVPYSCGINVQDACPSLTAGMHPKGAEEGPV